MTDSARRLPLALAVLAAGSMLACGVNVDSQREGFPCDPDGGCAAGLICSGGVCLQPDHVDGGQGGDGGMRDGGGQSGGSDGGRDGGVGDGGVGDGGVTDGGQGDGGGADGGACLTAGSTACTGCADGTGCTTGGAAGVCVGGSCTAGCLIGGATYAVGDPAPGNLCQRCDPAQDPTAFVAAPDASACAGDGNDCTNDVCVSGTCSHLAAADGTACASDGNDCTDDVCAAGVCAHPPVAAGSACSGTGTCNASGTCNVGCVIGQNSYPAGTKNPADACQLCDPTVSKTAWSNVADATACTDDGNTCTDDVCTSGTCTHPATAGGGSCGTGRVCDGGGTCRSGCFIGGSFEAPNATRPGNACQACDPSVSTTAWTNLGSATACASDSDPCTDDVCVSGTCGHPQVPKGTSCGSGLICLASGACAAGCDIGGTVYASGSKDPSNPCLVCTPSRSTSSWSQVAGGTSCDDGNLCNGVDTCQNGSCTQTTAPVTCNAPPTCKVSAGATCAPQTGSCSYPDASMGTACGGGLICDGSGGCVAGCDIGGRFYASGALDPAATCQACVPSSSTTAWSPAPNNTGCGTGSACCGGTCISVSTCNDCGSCGNSCFTGDICKSGSCAPTCFVAGTPIRLAGGGTRAIEAVRVGDEVLGYDTGTGRVEAARVLKTFLHPAAATPTTLVVNGHLRVTPNHPFYAGGAWVRADHLRVGDVLLEVGAHGAVRPTPVVSITRAPGGMRTYNLEVAGVHDYFAGDVLVHNKPVGCP